MFGKLGAVTLLIAVFSQPVMASPQLQKITSLEVQIENLKAQPKVSCEPFSDIGKIIMTGRQSGESSSHMKASFLSYGADPKILEFIDDAYSVELVKTKTEIDEKVSVFQDKLFTSCEETNNTIQQSIQNLENDLNILKGSVE